MFHISVVLSMGLLGAFAHAQTPVGPVVPAPAPAPVGPVVPGPGPARAGRPAPPTRDPHTSGYVSAKELPDGTLPSPKEDGNFILGPTHTAAPEMSVQDGVPQGTVFNFTMESKDSRIYPGITVSRGPSGPRIRMNPRS